MNVKTNSINQHAPLCTNSGEGGRRDRLALCNETVTNINTFNISTDP